MPRLCPEWIKDGEYNLISQKGYRKNKCVVIQGSDFIRSINYHTLADRHLIFLQNLEVFRGFIRGNTLFDLYGIQSPIFNEKDINFFFVYIPINIHIISFSFWNNGIALLRSNQYSTRILIEVEIFITEKRDDQVSDQFDIGTRKRYYYL